MTGGGSAMLAKNIRIDQTRRGLEQLAREIDAWAAKRRTADQVQQYFTQLNVLCGVLNDALSRVKPELDTLEHAAARTTISNVYEQCRKSDKRVVWIRRLWRFFKDKFDQRDDKNVSPTLFAADEIVWSCYSEVFNKAGKHANGSAKGSVPLTYIEPRYSPRAVPRAEPPQDLKSDVDSGFITECLAQLPIPVIGLPTVCLTEPWWLAFLAHEIGHHVQYNLLAEGALIPIFGALMRAAAVGPDLDPEAELPPEAVRWEAWGRETFADVFSVLQLGDLAVRAMTELETAADPSMLVSKPLYPAPVVRLALLASVADSLELHGQAALQWVDPRELTANADGEGAAVELGRLPAIVAALHSKPLGPLGTFPDLCSWDKAEFSRQTSYWSAELVKPHLPQPEQTARSARWVLGGALRAWHWISAIDDNAKRKDKQATLNANLVPTLQKSREEGTRSGGSPTTENIAILGERLTDLLSKGPE
jgi:hypothetical protein